MQALLRASDAAARLGWTLQRVYRLAAQNRLPHVRIGREVFFEDAELETWIAQRRVRPTAPKPSVETQRVVERARLGIADNHLFS